MKCDGCSGSGSCDPCDGYGYMPDSSPNAGDGADCEICETTGVCPDCDGTGDAPDIDDTAQIEFEFSTDENSNGVDG